MKSKNSLYFVFSAALYGCERSKPDPTPHINDMGVIVFFIFCAVIVLTLVLQKIQKTKFIERLRESIRFPVVILAFIQQLLGVSLIVMFYRSSEIYFLYSLIGGILVVGGFFMRRWAVTESKNQSIDLKIVTLSLSFAITLLWLIHYAAEKINF